MMSGAVWPLGPQSLQSHESRGSSFPLAFTFHVPINTRTWCYVMFCHVTSCHAMHCDFSFYLNE